MYKKVWQIVLFLTSSLAALSLVPAAVVHAETVLRSDAIISGGVEITTDGETWTAFSQDSTLKVGDSIRTGTNSAVSLKAEDGSILYLEEQTRLKIAELTFSAIDQARIFRFHLEQGTLTATLGKIETTADVFEVRTNSTRVRFHELPGSDVETSATIIANPSSLLQSNAALLASASNAADILIAKTLPPIGTTGSLGATEDPFASKVLPLLGEFELEQLNNERTAVEVTVGSGIDLSITMPGQKTTITVVSKTIWLKSDTCLQLLVVLGHGDNAVDITNFQTSNTLQIDAGTDSLLMEANSSLKIVISQNSDGRRFPVVTIEEESCSPNIKFVLSSSQDSVEQNRILITVRNGKIFVNGKPLAPGESIVLGDSEKREETFGEPPSTEDPSPGAGGGNAAPTPTPTPTPTPAPPTPAPTVTQAPGSPVQP